MINHLHLETHSFFGLEPGPRLLVLGRVHGNECCGTLAINKVLNLFKKRSMILAKGKVTFIPVTNPLAATQKSRNGDRNLNRSFYPKNQKNMVDFEDKLNNILCPILEECDVLLDLHSFLNGEKPFALIGGTSKDTKTFIFNHDEISVSESVLVSFLGIDTVITHWSETYTRGVKKRRERDNVTVPPFLLNYDEKYGDGTTEYARSKGSLAITLECGQHESVSSPDVGENAILNILSRLGMITHHKHKNLHARHLTHIRLFDVVDRICHEDKFSKDWKTFMRISENEIIGFTENGKKVRAPKDCFIIFPNQNAEPGQEWFYLGEES